MRLGDCCKTNDDTNGSLFGNIEQPPKNENQKMEVYHGVQ